MAYPLPPDDPERSRELERAAKDLGCTVTQMRAEQSIRRVLLKESKLADLIQERQDYLEACRRSEVDDTRSNIDRIATELSWLEAIQASPTLEKLLRQDPDACFHRLRGSGKAPTTDEFD